MKKRSMIFDCRSCCEPILLVDDEPKICDECGSNALTPLIPTAIVRFWLEYLFFDPSILPVIN